MTTNLISDWRLAVQTYLQVTFPDPTVVKSGRVEGVNREAYDLICVFWPGWTEIPNQITLATPRLLVRWFPSLSRQPTETSPRDEAPLEQAAVDLMTAFATKREAGAFVENLSCRVAAVTPHDRHPALPNQEWFVEAELRAFTLNIANEAA